MSKLSTCSVEQLCNSVVASQLRMINGWELVDYEKVSSAFEYQRYGSAQWKGVARKNGYVLRINRKPNLWEVRRNSKLIASGSLPTGVDRLAHFVYMESYYSDKKDFLCLDRDVYFKRNRQKSLRMPLYTFKQKYAEHVEWLNKMLPLINELNQTIISIDSACGGTGKDRLRWARKNVIRKTESYVNGNQHLS